jgi:hypothetical protein
MSDIPYLVGYYFAYLCCAFGLGWAFGWAVSFFKSLIWHGVKD